MCQGLGPSIHGNRRLSGHSAGRVQSRAVPIAAVEPACTEIARFTIHHCALLRRTMSVSATVTYRSTSPSERIWTGMADSGILKVSEPSRAGVEPCRMRVAQVRQVGRCGRAETAGRARRWWSSMRMFSNVTRASAR